MDEVHDEFVMGFIGTVMLRSKGLPKDLINLTNRPVGDYQVGNRMYFENDFFVHCNVRNIRFKNIHISLIL